MINCMENLASTLEGLLVDATIKQARYLFCFNSIVEELEDKEDKLKERQNAIKNRVEEEKQKRPDIVLAQDVTGWLQEVEIELDDVRYLRAKIDEKESCLHGLCPNCFCRYWLGRKASQKTSKLSSLLQDGSNFSTFGRPKPLPSEREFSIPHHFSSTFMATELARRQIIDALKKESTKMVGLYGLGGVGKTTLAKFVGNQLRQQEVFVKVGIATVSRKPNIIEVQRELAKSLGWELDEEDEKERAERLLSTFLSWKLDEEDEKERAERSLSTFSASKSSKILIILDDVWNKLDLKEKLGIPVGDTDNCCKILLTTRIESVCDDFHCDPKISLGTLEREEGLALLKKTAGIDVSDSTLDGVLEQVAAECKGLPLAITAVGSARIRRGFDEWNLALQNLRQAKLYAIEGIDKDEQDVYGCLKFSYDELNDDNSRLFFLLCSLFPEDYEIYLEDLVGYAVGLSRYRAESIEHTRSLLRAIIKGLKAASLLLDTGNGRSVKMHDIVRDVAIWISTKKEKDNERFFSIAGIEFVDQAKEEGLQQCGGISLVADKKEELRSDLVCPNLQILRLQNTLYDYKLKVPERFFEGMPKLKVVTIIGGVLSLKSLQCLADELRVLQLIQCDVWDASFLGKLKKLQILYLEESPIKIPELVNELNTLKLLYIGTGSIAPITKKIFPQLEEFYGRLKDWEVEGMSTEESCARLAELNSPTDGSVVCLPRDFTFPELQKYDIRNANDRFPMIDIRKVNDDDGQTRRLTIRNDLPEATSLHIFSALYQELEMLALITVTGCHNIVPSIDERGLNELTYLFVHDCKDLECLMDASQPPRRRSRNPVMLSKLATLCLIELPKLEWIWKAPAQQMISLRTLTELSVRGCNNLTYIFTLSLARSLEQLKSLDVSNCEKVECIVRAKFDHNEGEISVGDGNTIFALPLLRVVYLIDLPELSSFCSENYYSIWSALEELYLTECPKLTVNNTEIEANSQYLGEKLRILNVNDCFHLRDTIPALLKHGLKNLEKLYIWRIQVKVVFQLESIIADGQENKLFPCLEQLILRDLPELQVLYHEGPTRIFSLQNLTHLIMTGCTKLRRLLSSTLARNLLQLEELEIEDCWELGQIIDEDEDEDHLQPVRFPKLRKISVRRCPKLKHLFHISVAPSLQELNKLRIRGSGSGSESDELEKVFWHEDGADVMDYNEIFLNNLWELRLEDLPNLTSFWPAGYQIPFPFAFDELVRNCPQFRANSGRGRFQEFWSRGQAYASEEEGDEEYAIEEEDD